MRKLKGVGADQSKVIARGIVNGAKANAPTAIDQAVAGH